MLLNNCQIEYNISFLMLVSLDKIFIYVRLVLLIADVIQRNF